MKPLISVIIPSHNSAETIGTAIISLLNQTYTNIEIIVVDDNSTDTTKEVVGGFSTQHQNVRYYQLPFDDPKRFNKHGRNINAGYAARNFGFEQVQGEWITFQDADDASLRNRIEVQYNLAQQYNVSHVSVQWQQYKPEFLGKQLDVEAIYKEHSDVMIDQKTIYDLSQQTKGVAMKVLGRLHQYIPFEIKTKRVINKLFFRSLDSFPGSGNCPLFKRAIIDQVRFRALPQRVWPSFTGRGADRDFNFQVAETFKNCISFKLPLYLWRVNRQNGGYEGYEKYIV